MSISQESGRLEQEALEAGTNFARVMSVRLKTQKLPM